MDIDRFKRISQSHAVENRRFLQRLKKADSRELDKEVHRLHDEVFAETDCLQCGNCCKTTSPIFYPSDIDRAAKSLRIKPGDFMERYLRVDEDGDYVLQSSPCTFLGSDNRCSIYEDRPKACREYPHTNRKRVIQILDLTYKNTLVCPAVLEIVERLRKISS